MALTPLPALADCVVLLHGLGRTTASLMGIEKGLQRAGFATANIPYPSGKYDIQPLAKYAVEQGLTECGADVPVHFVTHSMGGILLRSYLQDHTIENMGRAVMLAPPNHGSELVDKFRNIDAFESLNGKASLDLGTGTDNLPQQLMPVSAEIGVIAGNYSYNPVFSTILPGPDDGMVTVESTKLAEMQDHIVLPVTHTFLMNNPLVIAQVISFLNTGSFDHSMTMAEMVAQIWDQPVTD